MSFAEIILLCHKALVYYKIRILQVPTTKNDGLKAMYSIFQVQGKEIRKEQLNLIKLSLTYLSDTMN
jgi:hypothetical protein